MDPFSYFCVYLVRHSKSFLLPRQLKKIKIKINSVTDVVMFWLSPKSLLMGRFRFLHSFTLLSNFPFQSSFSCPCALSRFPDPFGIAAVLFVTKATPDTGQMEKQQLEHLLQVGFPAAGQPWPAQGVRAVFSKQQTPCAVPLVERAPWKYHPAGAMDTHWERAGWVLF